MWCVPGLGSECNRTSHDWVRGKVKPDQHTNGEIPTSHQEFHLHHTTHLPFHRPASKVIIPIKIFTGRRHRTDFPSRSPFAGSVEANSPRFSAAGQKFEHFHQDLDHQQVQKCTPSITVHLGVHLSRPDGRQAGRKCADGSEGQD